MSRAQGGLGWGGIVRLGAVQAAIGAIVMLATSLLNRIMIVEYGLAAAIPAGLVAWHYAVQLSRPLWGHGSDGRTRTPWIIGGVGLLALGALAAVDMIALLAGHRGWALAGLVLSFTMIGAGVGMGGTALLALLAARVAPSRRAAAAATTWLMMVFGIVVSAGISGRLLDPYSPERLGMVAAGVCLAAFLVPLIALRGLERGVVFGAGEAKPDFRTAVAAVWREPDARRMTVFVFLSMLAYSMQDLILEPFGGLIFGMSPGATTSMSGAQHGGVMLGMILAGVGGSAFGRRNPGELRGWMLGGCAASALALLCLAQAGPGWPLVPNVFALGFANGVFAVSAIGAMMGLASAGGGSGTEGVRMGVFGAAQALGFGLGGLVGALGVDALRLALRADAQAFHLVFAGEAALFGAAAWLAWRATAQPQPIFIREGLAA